MPAAPRIGFIGIGKMGWPMARNLAAAGFPLQVHDAEAARAARFVAECGGAQAADAAALGRGSDIVITMLPSGREVREALLGPDTGGGVLAGLRPGAVVMDMSSSDPVGTRSLGSALLERGVALVDAPVSGLVTGAENGTLTIMIGADDEEAVARVEPVLACLGERRFRVGSLGCGHAMKALNNAVGATAFAATAEALIVGARFGLDPAVMTQVLDVSTGRSFHSAVSFPDHVLTRRFATGFSLGLLAKDVGTAAGLSGTIGTRTPLIELVSGLFAEGRDEIGADADNSAVIKRWERLNGVTIETGGETGPKPRSSG